LVGVSAANADDEKTREVEGWATVDIVHPCHQGKYQPISALALRSVGRSKPDGCSWHHSPGRPHDKTKPFGIKLWNISS
jgi:hypothetical protein